MSVISNIEDFGQSSNHQTARQFTLESLSGIRVKLTNYGGIITSICVPDKHGNAQDIVLGYDNLQSYLTETPYFGALIGRFANRIGKGQFVIDGTTYKLACNKAPGGIPCHLHGGNRGFDKRIWNFKETHDLNAVGIELSYTSQDMEEGYPGTLNVRVHYQLTDEGTLRISYHANTDKTTHINLTNHSYFNLEGHHHGSIHNHVLHLSADAYLPISPSMIPTGEIATVEGTPFDFRLPTEIGERINNRNSQLELAGGYDHNFVLNNPQREKIKIASILAPASGRQMEIWTDQPGVQFYSGNLLNGSLRGKEDTQYKQRSAFCLETQHYPDSPNHPHFPTTLLQPEESFTSVTEYRFATV